MIQRHYKPKKISKIKTSDRRVSIIGKVHSVNNNSFILDDDTGKIEIFISDETHVKEKSKIKEGALVRVFCDIDGDKLNANVFQILEDLDFNLFKSAEELYNKAGV